MIQGKSVVTPKMRETLRYGTSNVPFVAPLMIQKKYIKRFIYNRDTDEKNKKIIRTSVYKNGGFRAFNVLDKNEAGFYVLYDCHTLESATFDLFNDEDYVPVNIAWWVDQNDMKEVLRFVKLIDKNRKGWSAEQDIRAFAGLMPTSDYSYIVKTMDEVKDKLQRLKMKAAISSSSIITLITGETRHDADKPYRLGEPLNLCDYTKSFVAEFVNRWINMWRQLDKNMNCHSRRILFSLYYKEAMVLQDIGKFIHFVDNTLVSFFTLSSAGNLPQTEDDVRPIWNSVKSKYTNFKGK